MGDRQSISGVCEAEIHSPPFFFFFSFCQTFPATQTSGLASQRARLTSAHSTHFSVGFSHNGPAVWGSRTHEKDKHLIDHSFNDIQEKEGIVWRCDPHPHKSGTKGGHWTGVWATLAASATETRINHIHHFCKPTFPAHPWLSTGALGQQLSATTPPCSLPMLTDLTFSNACSDSSDAIQLLRAQRKRRVNGHREQ